MGRKNKSSPQILLDGYWIQCWHLKDKGRKVNSKHSLGTFSKQGQHPRCHGDNLYPLTGCHDKALHLCGHLPPKLKPKLLPKEKTSDKPKWRTFYKIPKWCFSKLSRRENLNQVCSVIYSNESMLVCFDKGTMVM